MARSPKIRTRTHAGVGFMATSCDSKPRVLGSAVKQAAKDQARAGKSYLHVGIGRTEHGRLAFRIQTEDAVRVFTAVPSDYDIRA